MVLVGFNRFQFLPLQKVQLQNHSWELVNNFCYENATKYFWIKSSLRRLYLSPLDHDDRSENSDNHVECDKLSLYVIMSHFILTEGAKTMMPFSPFQKLFFNKSFLPFHKICVSHSHLSNQPQRIKSINVLMIKLILNILYCLKFLFYDQVQPLLIWLIFLINSKIIILWVKLMLQCTRKVQQTSQM